MISSISFNPLHKFSPFLAIPLSEIFPDRLNGVNKLSPLLWGNIIDSHTFLFTFINCRDFVLLPPFLPPFFGFPSYFIDAFSDFIWYSLPNFPIHYQAM